MQGLVATRSVPRKDKKVSRGSVMLWMMFFWESLQTEYTSLWQQCFLAMFCADIAQERFEEHDKGFKVLTWPPSSPDLIERL